MIKAQNNSACKTGHVDRQALVKQVIIIQGTDSIYAAYIDSQQEVMAYVYQELSMLQKKYTGMCTHTTWVDDRCTKLLKQLEVKEKEVLQVQDSIRIIVKAKEEQLYQPIYEKVDHAINQVAIEQGFSYILDSDILLFSNEELDITALVRTRLGL